MSQSQCEGVEAVKLLGRLMEGEGWLISIEIAASRIEMICDFSSLHVNESDSEKILLFDDVSHLSFVYAQNIFGSTENDISTIDLMKIDKDHNTNTHDRWRVAFELTYGKLDFSFGSLKVFQSPLD